jgi:hypothetical protein
MRTGLAFSGLILAFGLAACAGFESTEAPNQIRLTGLEVASDPKVDVRYPAVLTYEAAGDVRVIDSCFTWFDADFQPLWLRDSTLFGNGPYCFALENDIGPDAVRSMLVTGYSGTYYLEGYLRYSAAGVGQKTNPVSTEITVTRRLP